MTNYKFLRRTKAKTGHYEEVTKGFFPTDIAKYYGVSQKLQGKGQYIAILDFGAGFDADSINHYFEEELKIQAPSVVVKNLPGTLSNGSPAEVYMDIEIAGAIAPKATIVLYRAPSSPDSFADAINAAVNDPDYPISVISISWGMPEQSWSKKNIQDIEQALAAAQKKAITVCAASGDGGSGDYMLGSRAFGATDDKVHVHYPASSPNVLACGGTEFLGEGDEIEGEQVWNNSNKGGGATGGGVSTLFDLPSWQKKAGIKIPSANKGKVKLGRVIPDVAAVSAFCSYQLRVGDQDGQGGGTSAATPLWAAMIALANEFHQTRLGNINPMLYQIGQLDQKASVKAFNDILTGNNRPNADYPGYEAQKGFDACTGWGSPRFKVLLQKINP